jgi:phosphoglycerol transferase MdoB-like AlkP superfamily enzyme
VIFILESFSRGYLQPGSPIKAYTPFFDSLLKKSIYFQNSYSQERSSNKGIVSILGSLPPITDEPFYYSAYATSFKKGIGHIFNENGYNTSFFYGTEYDHFGFKKWMDILGIQNYYCRSDFDDPKLYDGNLGIYDEPWLQYMASKLNKMDTPFLSIEFTISTHWPYKIPADFLKEHGVPGQIRSQQSITYADYAFKRFFDSIKTKPWYNNTIFVFSADHWFPRWEEDPTPEDIINSYQIPIFIYDPSKNYGIVSSTLASQLDILPTIYALLGFKNEFTTFGRNLFDTSSKRYSYNHLYQNGLLQVFDNEYVLGFDKNLDSSMYLYDYKKDVKRSNNLMHNPAYTSIKDSLELQIKALVQQYSNAVLKNRLTK